MFADERIKTLEILAAKIPIKHVNEAEKRHNSNPDFRESKWAKKDNITVNDIIEFNSEFTAAINEFETCHHLFQKNLTNIYYYENIILSINERNDMGSSRFSKYVDRELLFRVIPGFGTI